MEHACSCCAQAVDFWSSKLKRALRMYAIPIVLVILVFGLGIYSRSGNWPTGYDRKKLAPCPNKPNCVCSEQSDQSHQVDPIKLSGDRDADMTTIEKTLTALPRTKLVTRDPDYLHFVAVSAIIGYADDVEFRWDEQAKVVHVRSASRVGHSDLGANRARVDYYRNLLTKKS